MAIKIIKLTEEQNDCVKFKAEGELLIRGIPGAGKTTVVLERAIFLQKQAMALKSSKVILLTYNNALSIYLQQIARASNDEAVEALTFHTWGSQLLRQNVLLTRRMIKKGEGINIVLHAKRTVAKYGDPDFPKVKIKGMSEERALATFLKEEFSWIKNNNIKDRQNYLSTQRIGRGNQVNINKSHKETIYDTFEKYQQLLRNKYYCVDFDDIAVLLMDNYTKIPSGGLPDHILIDEAQDLSPIQFMAIKKLAQKSITIAADKGQQIYRRTFTWKSVGIEIRGGRSKLLSKSFRSTKQIIQLARSLQKHDKLLINDDEFLPTEDPVAEGPKPELIISQNKKDEIQSVVRKIRQINGAFPADTIAIISYSHDRLVEFEEELNEYNIVPIHIKSEEADLLTPGVKLVTFQSSKGLEFDHVIVTGLKEGILPHARMEPGDDPEAYEATERRKLYVAMTRAKLTLTLSAVRPISPFVRELDSGLYQ
jgi:superfamily I DNA/RNA helicase